MTIIEVYTNNGGMRCYVYHRQQNQDGNIAITPVRAISFGTVAVSLRFLMNTTEGNVHGLFEPHGDFQGDLICDQAGMSKAVLKKLLAQLNSSNSCC